MTSVLKAAAVAALLGVSAPATAWWGPGWGGPYGYSGSEPAYGPLTEEQQRAVTDPQAEAILRAVEAQRRFAEQLAAQEAHRLQSRPPYPSPDPKADMAARRAQIDKWVEAHRAEITRRVAEQRLKLHAERGAQIPADVAARRDAIQREIDSVRNEKRSPLDAVNAR